MAATVPEFVRRCLEHYQEEEGLAFMVAWTRSLQAIPRGTNPSVVAQRREWIGIMKWARPSYQEAYEHRLNGNGAVTTPHSSANGLPHDPAASATL